MNEKALDSQEPPYNAWRRVGGSCGITTVKWAGACGFLLQWGLRASAMTETVNPSKGGTVCV